jgi:CheY-like chemotaxis protein
MARADRGAKLTGDNSWPTAASYNYCMTRTRTVLVVEDNSIEREGMAAVLRQEGFDAVLAANGKEALERLQGKPTPDVMLLDMMMSEMDGWQLLKMLRQLPDLVQVPVIIVTGLGIANIEWARSLARPGWSANRWTWNI